MHWVQCRYVVSARWMWGRLHFLVLCRPQKQIDKTSPEPQTIPTHAHTHDGGYCVFNLHSASFANCDALHAPGKLSAGSVSGRRWWGFQTEIETSHNLGPTILFSDVPFRRCSFLPICRSAHYTLIVYILLCSYNVCECLRQYDWAGHDRLSRHRNCGFGIDSSKWYMYIFLTSCDDLWAI